MLFLDRAKLTRVIDYDPCLFNRSSSYKVREKESSKTTPICMYMQLVLYSVSFTIDPSWWYQVLYLTCLTNNDSMWNIAVRRIKLMWHVWLKTNIWGNKVQKFIIPAVRSNVSFSFLFFCLFFSRAVGCCSPSLASISEGRVTSFDTWHTLDMQLPTLRYLRS